MLMSSGGHSIQRLEFGSLAGWLVFPLPSALPASRRVRFVYHDDSRQHQSTTELPDGTNWEMFW